MNSFWHQHFLALPAEKKSLAYRRLKRVFLDHTWLKGKVENNNRLHDLDNMKSEMHLTCTLWENFNLFSPESWLRPLLEHAQIESDMGPIAKASWSYEYEAQYEFQHRKVIPLADVVIKYSDGRQTGILVIEAKRPGETIKPGSKDTIPDYYLSNPAFSPYSRNKALVYCVGSSVMKEVPTRINPPSVGSIGFISWNTIHSIQLQAVETLEVTPAVKDLIKSCLQFQADNLGITAENTFVSTDSILKELQDCQSQSYFNDLPQRIQSFVAGARYYFQHRLGIKPDYEFPEYLKTEPSFQDLDNPDWKKQTTAERRLPLWDE